MLQFDVTFTKNGIRYCTDTETFRLLYEIVGTDLEDKILTWGLTNGKIKEVARYGGVL